MNRLTASRRLAAALLVGCTALTGAANAQTTPNLRAPHLKPDLTTAEGGIWDQSDKAESHVRASAELDSDPVLTAYVGGVVCRVAPEYCGDLRTYVLDRPVFNAAAAPNGYVEVNSGLLLRVRDEDELAFVLGHEVSHFARNHTFARFQAQKNTANAMMVLTAGITIAAAGAAYSTARAGGPYAGQNINTISSTARSLNDLVYLSSIASLFSFSREEETEADQLGFQRAQHAGYRPGASVDLWNGELDEARASDFPKVRTSEVRASIFDTHPVTSDRIAALTAMGAGVVPAAASPATTADAARRYRAVVRPHLGDWLKDDLRRRDYGQTLFLIDRLAGEGEDLGLLSFYRGETYRHRRAPGDDALALASYRAATVQPDAPAAAWRELGQACHKAGDQACAKDAFSRYIEHDPKAQDRWLVEADLKSMQQAGGS